MCSSQEFLRKSQMLRFYEESELAIRFCTSRKTSQVRQGQWNWRAQPAGIWMHTSIGNNVTTKLGCCPSSKTRAFHHSTHWGAAASSSSPSLPLSEGIQAICSSLEPVLWTSKSTGLGCLWNHFALFLPTIPIYILWHLSVPDPWSRTSGQL